LLKEIEVERELSCGVLRGDQWVELVDRLRDAVFR
jgi:hypothetical protein